MKRTPARAMSPQQRAPKANSDQLVKEALGLGDLLPQVGVLATSVQVDNAPPAGAYDADERAVSLAIADELSRVDAKALAEALGLSPEVIQEDLDRQAAAWGGFGEVWSIRLGARHGRQLIDAARVLARGIVRAAVNRLKARLPPNQAEKLESDFQESTELEARKLADQKDELAITKRLTDSAEQQLGAIGSRRHLLSTLEALANKDQPDWDTLVKAGATLDDLLAQSTEGPQTSKKPGKSKKHKTPDQRGQQRG